MRHSVSDLGENLEIFWQQARPKLVHTHEVEDHAQMAKDSLAIISQFFVDCMGGQLDAIDLTRQKMALVNFDHRFTLLEKMAQEVVLQRSRWTHTLAPDDEQMYEVRLKNYSKAQMQFIHDVEQQCVFLQKRRSMLGECVFTHLLQIEVLLSAEQRICLRDIAKLQLSLFHEKLEESERHSWILSLVDAIVSRNPGKPMERKKSERHSRIFSSIEAIVSRNPGEPMELEESERHSRILSSIEAIVSRNPGEPMELYERRLEFFGNKAPKKLRKDFFEHIHLFLQKEGFSSERFISMKAFYLEQATSGPEGMLDRNFAYLVLKRCYDQAFLFGLRDWKNGKETTGGMRELRFVQKLAAPRVEETYPEYETRIRCYQEVFNQVQGMCKEKTHFSLYHKLFQKKHAELFRDGFQIDRSHMK